MRFGGISPLSPPKAVLHTRQAAADLSLEEGWLTVHRLSACRAGLWTQNDECVRYGGKMSLTLT